MNKLPKTTFSTRLSGSAKETELRIRSIFQWKKQRPPVWLMAAVTALILSCGGLVSCQVQGGQSSQPPAQSGEGWDAQAVLDALYQASDAAELFPDGREQELLDTAGTGEDITLAAGYFYDRYPRYALVIGAVDRSGQVVGAPFEVWGSGGRPHVTAFSRDGAEYLLYTAGTQGQGYSQGSAGVIRLDGDAFTWVWPVEGDVREESSQAYEDYNAYWDGKKPLMAPGGLDIFEEDPEYSAVVSGSRQWLPVENQTFWPAKEEELPTGVLWQTRMWMEEHLPQYVDSYPGSDLSAAWQMVSLVPEDGTYPSRNFQGTAVYRLTARMDSAPERVFTARLSFDHGGGGVIGVLDYSETVQGEPVGPEMDETFYALLRDWYNGQYPNERWYFMTDQPGAPKEGDLRMGPIYYEGGMRLNETIGEVYTVEMSRYEKGQFRGLPDPNTLVLSRSGQDGVLQRVLGALAHDTSGMTMEDIVLNVALGLLDAEAALRRDGWDTPIGPGMDLSFSCLDTGNWETEQLEGYEPIYNPGDYWYRVSADYPVGSFTALCYHNAAANTDSINTLDTSMSDLTTCAGIRVGASRAEVLKAYPLALTGDYWGQYPEEPDLLAYLPWSGHDPEQISDLSQLEFHQRLGPAILFLFQADRVERIVLTNMFN